MKNIFYKYVFLLNSNLIVSNNILGGKACSLHKLSIAGFKVPDGFVIITDAFQEFIEYNNLTSLISNYINLFNCKNFDVLKNFNKLKKAIMKSKFPKKIELEILQEFKNLKSEFVAVRSSAVVEDSDIASWAGQLDSFIYTNKKTLFNNIKKCWVSIFSLHALNYKYYKNINSNDFSMGIIVQKMINSDVSGIAFSINPINKSDEILIEAGFGLCESLVNGEINPDRYIYDKKKKVIVKIITGNQSKYKTFTGIKKTWKKINKNVIIKRKISNKLIDELISNIFRIEKLYKHPVDVEWTIQNNVLYILQVRSITS